jgi:hypothetical protein
MLAAAGAALIFFSAAGTGRQALADGGMQQLAHALLGFEDNVTWERGSQ